MTPVAFSAEYATGEQIACIVYAMRTPRQLCNREGLPGKTANKESLDV